jgi:hypothetical protein
MVSLTLAALLWGGKICVILHLLQGYEIKQTVIIILYMKLVDTNFEL